MGNEKTPQRYMVDMGVKILFQNYSYSRRNESAYEVSMKNRIIKSEDVLKDALNSAVKDIENDSRSDFLSSLMKHAEDYEIDVVNIPFWEKPINDMCLSLLDDKTRSHEILNGYRQYALSAAELKSSFDWSTLFLKVYEVQKSNNYVRDAFKQILSNYASNFEESFKEFCDNEIFFSKTKPGYAARGALYSQYIKSGFLTEKSARKIRSDASSDASVAGLRALLESKDLYDDYDNLLLKFTDSKYDEIISLLADGLPEYLITSIMGTTSYWGKKKIEDRLERIEREKEAATAEVSHG